MIEDWAVDTMTPPTVTLQNSQFCQRYKRLKKSTKREREREGECKKNKHTHEAAKIQRKNANENG